MTEPDVEMGVPGPGWYTGNQPGRIDDRKLVRQALAGDERACSIIVERYTPAVMGCIAGKVRSRSDMEDLAQEVFLRAFRFLHTLRDPIIAYVLSLGIAYSLFDQFVKTKKQNEQY